MNIDKAKKGKIIRLFYFFLLFLIFLANTFHDEYPDEFDNILGGWHIINGKLPYRDFFSHHNPGAYFIAALIAFFTRRSFVWFRVLLAVFYFLMTTGSFLLLKKRLKKTNLGFYLLYLFILGIGATYFWGHMLLADNLAGYFLLPAYALLFLKTFYKEKIDFKDLAIISGLTFLTLWTTLTYAYLVAIINLFALFKYLKEKGEEKKSSVARFLRPITLMIVPYILFLFYLVFTGSLKDFYFQSLDFNARYYIYNYPKPENSAKINPIRYAIIIANNFFNEYHLVLLQLKDFNFPFPVNSALAITNVSLFLYLLVRKRFRLAAFVLATLVYTMTRSSPLSGERDYQAAVFYLLSLFNAAFIFTTLIRELKKEKEYFPKMIFSFFFLLISVYWFYNLLFLYRKFNERVFNKYMGTAPLIYDRPEVAPIINAVTDEEDYVWAGPFEFEELFFLKGKFPSKYQVLLPEFPRSERIKSEFMADFERNKPKIIMFRIGVGIRNHAVSEYGRFFLEFLDENYIRLLDYVEDGTKFKPVKGPTLAVDIERNFYIAKENKDEIIKRLLENNFIKKIKVE